MLSGQFMRRIRYTEIAASSEICGGAVRFPGSAAAAPLDNEQRCLAPKFMASCYADGVVAGALANEASRYLDEAGKKNNARFSRTLWPKNAFVNPISSEFSW